MTMDKMPQPLTEEKNSLIESIKVNNVEKDKEVSEYDLKMQIVQQEIEELFKRNLNK